MENGLFDVTPRTSVTKNAIMQAISVTSTKWTHPSTPLQSPWFLDIVCMTAVKPLLARTT